MVADATGIRTNELESDMCALSAIIVSYEYNMSHIIYQEVRK